uniref:hypothetical protein n=1 Tax=Parabacteroides distasonis TaxID=823 RepID=UPI004026FFEA
ELLPDQAVRGGSPAGRRADRVFPPRLHRGANQGRQAHHGRFLQLSQPEGRQGVPDPERYLRREPDGAEGGDLPGSLQAGGGRRYGQLHRDRLQPPLYPIHQRRGRVPPRRGHPGGGLGRGRQHRRLPAGHRLG